MSRARDLSRLGNSSVLSVSADNNVGINSTSPVEKLNVVGVVSATSFFGDGASLTGIDATSLKDSGGNIKAQANQSGVVVTGVTTSTSFDGNLNATQLASGTVADARLGTVSSSKLSGALPALDGSALTNLNIPAGFNELDAALFN
jgi:hypothetical protein|tara:strand:- start:132 stop:569 length:438 start_codon:yes stop_codon:yes gene_type:complete